MGPRSFSWPLPVPSELPGLCLLLFLASRPWAGAGSVLRSGLLPSLEEAQLTLATSTPTQEIPCLSRSPQDPEKFWSQTIKRATQMDGLTQLLIWPMRGQDRRGCLQGFP